MLKETIFQHPVHPTGPPNVRRDPAGIRWATARGERPLVEETAGGLMGPDTTGCSSANWSDGAANRAPARSGLANHTWLSLGVCASASSGC